MNVINALYTSLRFAPEGKTLTDMQKGAWGWYFGVVKAYPGRLWGFVIHPDNVLGWGIWLHNNGQVYWISDSIPPEQIGMIEIDPTTMRIKEEEEGL